MTIHRDRAYLNWLREQPCAVTGRFPPCDPCHTFKSTGGGGMGMKSADKFALPLCHEEHMKQSGMSEVKYWRDVLINNLLLRMKMITCYTIVYSNHQSGTPAEWMMMIKEQDFMIKRLVQSFAEIGYYYQFQKLSKLNRGEK